MTVSDPPSNDPRWANTRIQNWRLDCAAVADSLSEDSIVRMCDHLAGELKSFGITTITEDLVLLLWGTLPVGADFIRTSIEITCQYPPCAHASMMHAVAGLDMIGATLLTFEKRIGQAL